MDSVHYGPFNTLDEMLFELGKIGSDKLDASTQNKKLNLLNHPMKNVLYSVLCDIKNKNACYQPQALLFPKTDDSNMIRLNTMLATEATVKYEDGLSNSGTSHMILHCKEKLSRVYAFYNDEIQKYESSSQEFVQHSTLLLNDHQRFRPIIDAEIQMMISVIRRKLSKIELELKQNVCEIIIGLKSRSVDNRRRRRNFSKQAIDILNEYFYAHNPTAYPSEEEKEELARRCGITVSQVSNWFGNKRIRNKKNLKKQVEEQHLFRQKKAAEANKYGMLGGYHTAISSQEILPSHTSTGHPSLYAAMPADNLPYQMTPLNLFPYNS